MTDQKPAPKQQLVSSKSNASQIQAWTPNDRASVAHALGKIFDVQKQFGKTPAQLKTIIEGFLLGATQRRVLFGLWANICCSVPICQRLTIFARSSIR